MRYKRVQVRAPAGFEPATKEMRSTARFLKGAPGRIRTCDQEIRRLLLYPLSYGGGHSQNTAAIRAFPRHGSGRPAWRVPGHGTVAGRK